MHQHTKNEASMSSGSKDITWTDRNTDRQTHWQTHGWKHYLPTYSSGSNIIFRWFKFKLKPPYSIPIGKLQLVIWDTFFWTFLVKFGHKGPCDKSQDLFWWFLKYITFWQFQGHLSTFQKMGAIRKLHFMDGPHLDIQI